MGELEEEWPSDDLDGPCFRDLNIESFNKKLKEEWDQGGEKQCTAYARTHLAASGWPHRTLEATPGQVPVAIRAVLLRQGSFPTDPFGLVGPVGCGKTCALASLAIDHIAATRWAHGPSVATLDAFGGIGVREPPPPPRVIYANWPSISLSLRMDAGSQDFRNAPELEAWGKDPKCILVLDDLGAERMREGKTVDRERLEVVVDHAYHHRRPLFWTSNLQPEQLDSAYGKRFTSRLLGLAPAIRLPHDLKDLRR